MVAGSKEQLAVGYVGTESSQVEVVGEGVQVEQDLDVVHLVQEGVDGKLWQRQGISWCWKMVSCEGCWTMGEPLLLFPSP